MKKICVVVASRANYGRVKYLMKAIKENSNLELLLIVGASALLDRFGNITQIIEADGFKINRFSVLSGYLSSKRPGDRVEVNFVREGKLKTAIVTLKKSSN